MIDRDETFRPQTFMGHKLNELGEVEGAIPVMKHFTDELHDRIIQEQNSYVYRMCMELNIDPKVLEKQLIEIKRLQFVINQKDDEIKELKTQIESMKKTLTEISEYADEKPIHNIAQNELDKWELAERLST